MYLACWWLLLRLGGMFPWQLTLSDGGGFAGGVTRGALGPQLSCGCPGGHGGEVVGTQSVAEEAGGGCHGSMRDAGSS